MGKRAHRGAEGGRNGALSRRQALVAWGFCLPFVLVFGVFMLVPLLSSMGMSFTDITSRDLRTPFNVNIVGFDNYVTLLTDPRFHKALLTTAIFVIVGLPITIAIAMAFAVALNKGLKHLNAFFRAVFYAPVVASVVAVSVVWRYILQDDGLLNSLLAVFGINGPDWLHDTRFALPALMIMTIWRNMGTLMIIFLAGLQAIPTELKEAASVDGAGKWRTFVSITLPLMKPTILLGAVLISVAYLQFFEESFVMTQGGPLDSTLSAAYYVYQQFGFGRYGIASAASWVLFVIIAGIPDALMEAARIDGAGELRIFFQIILPQCGPAMATLAILTFLSSWNNFLWPLVAAQTDDMYTLPVALSLYSTGQNATNYSVLLAGAVLITTPILLLFVFLQRYFIQGVAMTGIK